MINNRLVYFSIIFSALLMVILVCVPTLDIDFSRLFYYEGDRFLLRKHFLVKFFYLSVPFFTKIFLLSISVGAVYLFWRYKKISIIGIYLISSISIGPGLIVNYVLKNQFGRARPKTIIHFNRLQQFTPAFQISDQCYTNCSFSSGHAAMAFGFTSIAYTMRKRYFSVLYIAALVFGGAVSWSRIAVGAHFLSDVATSSFIVLVVNHLLFLCLLKNPRSP